MPLNKERLKIFSQSRMAEDVFSMWLESEGMAEKARPGQFVCLYCRDGARLLPRPISICRIDRSRGRLQLVYRLAGEGTREFSRMKAGEFIDVMGPLGNGFPLRDGKALILGGGIGIPPMLELSASLNCEKQIVLGYRDTLFLNEEFQRYGAVHLATEDGSAGIKGNVLDVVREKRLTADVVYACGPAPMLRAVKDYAAGEDMECYLSLEERMACGIGACLACVCGSKDVDGHTNVKNKRVCKDGPVFSAGEVEF